MKTIKRVFGVVALTAVMAVGAMEVFTPKEAGACSAAFNCTDAEANFNTIQRRGNTYCSNTYSQQLKDFCGYNPCPSGGGLPGTLPPATP